MNFYKYINRIFAFLPIIITAVVYPFLPATVPMHFGFFRNADKMGAKYQMFLIPILVLMISYKYFFTESQYNKNKKEDEKEYFFSYVMFFANAIFFLFFYTSVMGIMNLSDIPLEKIICGIFYCLFVVLGDYLPTVTYNSILGVRTPWALKDKKNWRKTHDFSGKVFIVLGFLGFIANLFFSMISSFILLIIILTAIIFAVIFYSYQESKTV